MALAGTVTVGLTLITYGVGLAWAPGWWIMGGLSLVILAVLALVEV